MNPKASYAHLLQSNFPEAGAKGTKAKEVDENKSDKMENDPPANDKEDGKKAKRKAKAGEGDDEESEEDKEDSEGESDEEKEDKKEKKNRERDDKEDKKSKKAAAEGNDIRAAVLSERLRCAQIFRSDAAAGQPDVAAQFAFHTELDADSAIAIMEATKRNFKTEATTAPRKVSLDERMSTIRSPNVGDDAPKGAGHLQSVPTTEEGVKALAPDQKALMIVNAGRRNRGEEPLKSLQG